MSKIAEKLLAWFGLYKTTATAYDARLNTLPKVRKRGAFATALAELVAGGY